MFIFDMRAALLFRGNLNICKILRYFLYKLFIKRCYYHFEIINILRIYYLIFLELLFLWKTFNNYIPKTQNKSVRYF